MKYFLNAIFFTLFSFGVNSQQNWYQLGTDIDGIGGSDFNGSSVCMSSDGLTVAIGAYLGNYTRVFKYVSGAWVQVGGTIYGEDTGDYSGFSVSMNANGTIVAIGAPQNYGTIGSDTGHARVYQLVGGVWTQMGSDIDGEQLNNYFGHSVGLSADGLTLVVGAAIVDGIASNGYAKVFKYNGSSWVEQVQINGLANNDRGGYSVSISDDASTIAIGAIGHDANGIASGQVRIFKNTTGTTWVQQGASINGENTGDSAGESVSLNADGTIVAIGAIYNDGGGSVGNNRGHTRVFEFNSVSWVQLGSSILGETAGDEAGKSVSLSDDGLTVAIGATENDGGGTQAGHARVYKYNVGTGNWSKVGIDIDGDYQYDSFGESVSLSSDGLTIGIGAIGNDDNGSSSGQVKVLSYMLPPVYNTCTSTITTFPYNENFESFNTCSITGGTSCLLTNGWVNQIDDDVDWTTDIGGTLTSSTGPTTDYNPGTSTGKYLYLEASGDGYPYKEAYATPPCFDLTSVFNTELIFAYNMYGSTMGTLDVDVSTDNGATYTNVWTKSGNQGTTWKQATVDLSAYDGQTIKIRFRGKSGYDYWSDMAIDDVTVREGCPLAPTTTGGSRCGTGTVDLSATPGTGGSSCKWYTDLTGGAAIHTGNTYTTPSISVSTTYYVSTFNASCESTPRIPVVATINNPATPTITPTGSTALCFGKSTQLTSSAGDSYAWYYNNSLMTETTQSITISQAGNYTVVVTENSCTSPTSNPITITVLPQPSQGVDIRTACVSLTWINGTTYYVSNNTATHTILNGNVNGCDSIVRLDLTVGDFEAPVPDVTNLPNIYEQCAVTSLNIPTATDNCAGNFFGNPNVSGVINTDTTITWYYEDLSGNISSQIQRVYINDNTPPVPDVANLADIYADCITLEVTSLTAPTATDNCSGSITGTHNASLPITSNTTVTWTYDDGNGNTSTQTQYVYASPIDNSVTLNGITITANASGYDYQWVDCDNSNTPISGANNQSYVATANGNYAVILDNGHCSDISTCTLISTVGTSEIGDTELVEVYPNPTTGTIYISSSVPFNKVELMNALGQKVATNNISETEKYLLILPEQNGVYFVKVYFKESTIIKRIVKS